MTPTKLPTAAQIGAYLTAHGWRFARSMKEPGAVYVYHQPADDGKPIELFVPDEHGLDLNGYGRSVMAVVDTIKCFEQRDWRAVLADMLATDVAPAARTLPASVA
ncbi:MAG: hypothetical protein J0I06_25210 [Planctomycetes bacterium]|nr:hypothetical protein [Planctomycetota bacterium]